MAWSVQQDSELGLIEIVYTGQVTDHDVAASTVEALGLAATDKPNLFFGDLTDADLDLSPGEIYFLPDRWEAGQANRKNKLALYVPDPADMRIVQFHVNTARNRGWQVAAFTDRQDAIDWLTG